MTTIAYKNGVLAADTSVTSNAVYVANTLKIHRVNGWLVGGSGSVGAHYSVSRWLEAGADFKKPVDWGSVEDAASIIVSPGGALYHTDTGSGWVVPEQTPFVACGSGADFARAAMLLGCSARDAVAVAIQLDLYSGGRIVWLNLDGTEDLGLPKEIYKVVNSR